MSQTKMAKNVKFVNLVYLKRKIAKNVKGVNLATLKRKIVTLRKIVKFVAEFNPGH